MIDLNDESYDGGSNVKIFNGGTAGLVDNVTATVDRKAADGKEGAPDYKMVYSDASGASCNSAYWYVTGADNWGNSEQDLLTKQGKILKHLAHCFLGTDFVFPKYNTGKEMLDGIMKLIHGAAPSVPVRILATYGTTMSKKNEYIQPRSYVPFVEPMTVAAADTRLKAGDIDVLERVTADSETPSVAVGDDSDW